MRDIVGGQYAASNSEFVELALGIDSELFTVHLDGESEQARAARLDAARDILDDLREHDWELADYAGRLLHGDAVVVCWPPQRSRNRRLSGRVMTTVVRRAA